MLRILQIILIVIFILLPNITYGKSGGLHALPISSNYWGTQPNDPLDNWPAAYNSTGRIWPCANNTTWWNVVETANGVYNWTAIDACVADYQARGVQMIFTFGRVPGWANGNAGAQVPPTSNTSISTFASALATRYAGKIKYYECWNEANDTVNEWSGTVAQMVAVCSAIKTAVQTADSNAIMLTPSITDALGILWMQQYLAAGGGSSASIFNYHGYAVGPGPTQPPEQVYVMCQQFKAMQIAYGISNYEMWIDEGGWGDGTVTNTANLQEAYGSIYPLLFASCGVNRQLWYQYDLGTGGSVWGQQWTGTALTSGGQSYFTTQSMLNGSVVTQPIARILGTNGIRNTTMTGAIAGTPGTLPTDWAPNFQDSANGISTQVVGTGIENGINYVDLRVFGTATSGAVGSTQFQLEANYQIAAVLGQTWTFCVNVKQINNTNNNANLILGMNEYNPTTGYLQSDGFWLEYPSVASLNYDILCTSTITSSSAVQNIAPLISIHYSASTTIDMTIRVGAPTMDTGTIWTGQMMRYDGTVIQPLWNSIGGSTTYPTPANCLFTTNFAGTKSSATTPLTITNVPVYCTNK
jgi:Cellulase (glycosyl hydrolase family 5)